MPYVRRFELRTSQSADELKAWYIRRYRDARTESDFLRIKFPRIGAAPSYLYVPVSLTERPADLAKLLTDKGANWSPDVTERRKAIEIIAKKLPDQIGTMLSQGGWHGEIFMLGTDPIGCKDQRYILRNEFVQQANESIGCSGTLAEWQERVARPAAKSRYAMFAIMHGLAAPLFRFAGLDEGAIFHLGGDGSTGKTSALMAGASVAGASELTDWNSSERGMHERAAIMSGLQIVLDDTERQPATAARVAALNTLSHTLTSGRSQTYSRVVKGSLPDLRWDCWALSSGPSTMEHAAQKVGYTRTDGDRVRWIDIPSPAAVSGGIWDLARCDSEEDYARLSEALREAASQFHGEVARKWIRLLQVNQNLCREHIPTAIERFISRNCPDAGSVERRIARKFGLVYAAGFLAVRRGILPWGVAEARKACDHLFAEAMADRRRHLNALPDLIVRFRETLISFPRIKKSVPQFADNDFAGYRTKRKGVDVVYVRRDWLERFCGPLTKRLLDQLVAEQVIQPGEGARSGKQVRVLVGGNLQKPRFLMLDEEKLLG